MKSIFRRLEVLMVDNNSGDKEDDGVIRDEGARHHSDLDEVSSRDDPMLSSQSHREPYCIRHCSVH